MAKEKKESQDEGAEEDKEDDDNKIKIEFFNIGSNLMGSTEAVKESLDSEELPIVLNHCLLL